MIGEKVTNNEEKLVLKNSGKIFKFFKIGESLQDNLLDEND